MLQNSLIDLLTPIKAASSSEDLLSQAKKVGSEIGFSYYSTVTRDVSDVTKPDVSLSHNYPKSWEKLYFERSYFSHDPANKQQTLSMPIYVWNSEGTSEVFNAARDFSINSGVTCSVRGAQFICSVSFASQRDVISPEMMMGAEFIAPYLANSLVRTAEKESPTNDTSLLTEREVECLRWVSVGKTSWEISVILSISERTVLFHLANSQRKLGTCSRAHSVAKAMVLGLLDVDLSDCDPFITQVQDQG